MSDINSYNKLYSTATQFNIPLHCIFELTYRCNLSCKHCYIVKNRKKELQKKEIFKILDQLKEAGCLYLTLSGGEPLIREDFFDIARYALKLNFAIRIFTNGTLIDENIADRIKDIKPISIEISLYGFRNTHEKITKVKGSFDKTIRAIKLLKERNLKVFMKSILLKQNIDEIWELKDYVKNDLKVNWRGIGGGLLLSPCDDGNRKPLKYRPTDSQFFRYFKKEMRVRKDLGKEYKPRRRKANKTVRFCSAGQRSLNITPYGELNPCVQIRLNNNEVLSDNLIDVWRNHSEIKHIRSLKKTGMSACVNCEFMPFCTTCPGVALLEQGSLTAKLPESCRQAKIRKEVYEKYFKKNKV